MQLYTTLPYKFLPLDSTLDIAAPEMAFIVKASFALENWEHPIALPAGEQADFSADTPFMDEIGRSLRYASDLVPFKPFGEVLLTADCHAPNGEPASMVEVELAIGPLRKRLNVFGDRVWLQNEQGQLRIEGPTMFRQLPLRWERAFGGLSHPQNPMGRGLGPWQADDGRKLFYLANIESPNAGPRQFGQIMPSACFAPVSRQWQPRLSREGTRDQHWATFVAPLPPRDLDPRVAQAAPDDQWLKTYWTGDERIELRNMHPEHEVFVTDLPGQRLRLFVEEEQQGDQQPRFGEVELALDTVHIDLLEARLHLVWRRRLRTRKPAAGEYQAAYLAQEPLSQPPAPVEAHYRDYRALKGPAAEPRAVQMARDEQAALAQARKTLIDAKIDPATIASFDAAPDTQAKFAMIMDLMKAKTAELEAMTAAMKPL